MTDEFNIISIGLDGEEITSYDKLLPEPVEFKTAQGAIESFRNNKDFKNFVFHIIWDGE